MLSSDFECDTSFEIVESALPAFQAGSTFKAKSVKNAEIELIEIDDEDDDDGGDNPRDDFSFTAHAYPSSSPSTSSFRSSESKKMSRTVSVPEMSSSDDLPDVLLTRRTSTHPTAERSDHQRKRILSPRSVLAQYQQTTSQFCDRNKSKGKSRLVDTTSGDDASLGRRSDFRGTTLVGEWTDPTSKKRGRAIELLRDALADKKNKTQRVTEADLLARKQSSIRTASEDTLVSRSTGRSTDETENTVPTAAVKRKASAARERDLKATKKADEAKERQRIRAVNLLKTDRKETVKELTVHVTGMAFNPALATTATRPTARAKQTVSPWIKITESVREQLAEFGCRVRPPEDDPTNSFGTEGAIWWTRFCDRQWNDDKQRFEPLPKGQELTIEEDTRLVFLDGLEISTLVSRGEFLKRVTTLKESMPPSTNLIILIMGLKKLYRQIENAANAVYTTEIRRQLNGEDVMAGNGSLTKQVGIGVNQPTPDTIEQELMSVQIKTRCYYIHVDKEEDAAHWIAQLTMDVAQKPYQLHKQKHVVELGSIDDKQPSGSDLYDTYCKMLSSIKGVTEPVAKSIASEFPTVWSLYKAWSECACVEDEKQMLVGIAKTRNITGASTHRALGKVTSETIWKVFNSVDPQMFM